MPNTSQTPMDSQRLALLLVIFLAFQWVCLWRHGGGQPDRRGRDLTTVGRGLMYFGS